MYLVFCVLYSKGIYISFNLHFIRLTNYHIPSRRLAFLFLASAFCALQEKLSKMSQKICNRPQNVIYGDLRTSAEGDNRIQRRSQLFVQVAQHT